MKSKKIIWIVHGVNKIYQDMFEALKKENPNLDLIMTGNLYNKKYKNFKNKYFKLKLLKRKNIFKFLFFPFKLLHYIKGNPNCDITTLYYFKDMQKFLKEEKPDLVIANLYYRPSTWQAARYCRKNNIPLFLQTEIKQLPKNIFANILIRLSFIFLIRLFNQSKLVLPWAEDGVEFAKKYFPVRDKNKIQLLPAGVNSDICYPVKNKLYKEKVIKILSVGRLVPFKRHIDLLNAFKYVSDKIKTIKYSLTICSSGPLENTLKQQAKDLNINVNFIKNIPYEEMYKLFNEHNFLVLSSYNEAIGMVVPEAMLCGCPCIVSDTCGSKMYIKKNIGIIFETFNVNELPLKIILMSLLFETFGKDAHIYIKNNYTSEKIGKKMNKKIQRFI